LKIGERGINNLRTPHFQIRGFLREMAK